MVIALKKNQRIPVYALSFLFLMFFTSVAFADDSGITINLRRNYGTDMGDGRRMGGDWTISGSGPEGTIKISIFFNETEVYSTQSRDYSFRFNTYDYPTGEVNITVRAYFSDTQFVSRSIIREFLTKSSETWIFVGTIVFVVFAISIKYVLYRKRKQEDKKGVSIDQIKIDG